MSTSALLLLGACIKYKKGDAQAQQSGALTYMYQDVPPENHGGAWRRVWNLSGPYAADAAIDEMTDRNADNWKEIARTNREGVFVQKDTTKETKYRFDGYLETDWMPILTDNVITSLTAENNFKGHRCIVPEGTTLVITNQRLIFRCTETIIAGNILAYPGNSYTGRGAGNVDIFSDVITVNGKINLSGEQGTGGANGRDGGGGRENRYDCTNGGNGGLGGNGGMILLKARKKLTLVDEASQFSVAGGAGGWGGRGGRSPGNCHNGSAGPKGSDGTLQIISPERPLL